MIGMFDSVKNGITVPKGTYKFSRGGLGVVDLDIGVDYTLFAENGADKVGTIKIIKKEPLLFEFTLDEDQTFKNNYFTIMPFGYTRIDKVIKEVKGFRLLSTYEELP